MTSLEDLRRHLKARLPRLRGDWVARNSGYEGRVAKAINAELSDKRAKFWNCTWKGIRIELKKCQAHSWLDLLPYADYTPASTKRAEPVTLFLFHEGHETEISSISVMEMDALLKLLHIDKEVRRSLKNLSAKYQRHPNVQYRLTADEIRSNAKFNID